MEVLAFIIIVSIAAIGFTNMFRQVLLGSQVPVQNAQAGFLWDQWAERLKGEKHVRTFPDFIDYITNSGAYAGQNNFASDEPLPGYFRSVTFTGATSGSNAQCKPTPPSYPGDQAICATITITDDQGQVILTRPPTLEVNLE